MGWLRVVHGIVTLTLLAALVGLGLLAVTGVLEVRWHKPAEDSGGRPGGVSAPLETAGLREGPAGGADRVRAHLFVVRGLKPGLRFPVYEGDNVLGRADEKAVDIDLEDQEPPDRIWSSRQHALITCEGGELAVEDLNSSNGTYVNRDRVPPGRKRRLHAGDVIQIGAVQLKVTF